MALKEDVITKSIKAMAKVLAKVLFGKTDMDYELPGEEAAFTDTDYLYIKLMKLLEAGEINEAENLLFDYLEEGDKEVVKVALVFYDKLSECDEDYLRAHHFSSQEIMEALKEIANQYNLGDIAMRFSE